MKALFAQIAKFGLTGVLCTLIDYLCYSLCLRMGIPYLYAGVIGFSISVTINYILSMRWVFTPRQDLSRQRRFAVFILLSIIGLGLHEFLLYGTVEYILPAAIPSLSQGAVERIGKILATGAVMCWNFITRKRFFEKRDS